MRHLTALLLALLVALLATTPARAEEKVKIDEDTQKAVDKALAWLAEDQQKDGSWGRQSAITSFALLAYMSQGHLPGQGKFGPEVAKGVKNLLAGARDDGYLVGPGGGNMYSHGMAALALSQVWGMTGDEEVKKVLKKSIALIVKTQNHEGGWRYEPQPTGADISVTIMMVMALRGAKDSGLDVPKETMDKALEYIKKCHDPRSGGYRYQPGGGPAGYARTAAGVCVQQLCGKYEEKEKEGALKYMAEVGDDRSHYWYGAYYAAHAMHQVGGKAWEEYYSKTRKNLLAIQNSNGSWKDSRESGVGPAYQTAIAVLILSVPTDYLPIYQR
jgi:squalene cyclase